MRSLIVAALVASSGCCTLTPGSPTCEAAKYGQGWTHKNPEHKARCADELLAVADTLLPDPSLRPLHGVVVWYPGPFDCSMGQKVWGCAPNIERSYVTALVAAAPGVHASDTALAEEVGHHVWFKYRPWVLTEEWRKDSAGKWVYWRDPDFEAWFNLVRAETRGLCK